MKITIDEKEINSAVECYLAKQGVNVAAYDLTINVNAGRSDSGPRIEIDMTQKEVVESMEPAVKTGSPFDDKTEDHD